MIHDSTLQARSGLGFRYRFRFSGLAYLAYCFKTVLCLTPLCALVSGLDIGLDIGLGLVIHDSTC